MSRKRNQEEMIGERVTVEYLHVVIVLLLVLRRVVDLMKQRKD